MQQLSIHQVNSTTLATSPTLDNDSVFESGEPETDQDALPESDIFSDDQPMPSDVDAEELPNPDSATPADVDDGDVGPIRQPIEQDESGESGSGENGDDPRDLSMYNRRDCPQEIEIYRAAWTAFRNRPLSSISLDITPEFEPNQNAEEMAENRIATLGKTEGREWRDRSGRVVAAGLFKDFKDGRVIVETASGTTEAIEFHELSSSDLCFVSAWWGIPTEYQPDVEPYQIRNFTTQTFTWKASGLCHKPLYFEEVQLERYGHSAGPVKQTMLSGVHFFGNIIALPYKMGVHPTERMPVHIGLLSARRLCPRGYSTPFHLVPAAPDGRPLRCLAASGSSPNDFSCWERLADGRAFRDARPPACADLPIPNC